jgi:hypothetical protein
MQKFKDRSGKRIHLRKLDRDFAVYTENIVHLWGPVNRNLFSLKKVVFFISSGSIAS